MARYLKAALVGLLGGVALTIATVANALVIVHRRLAGSMQRIDGVHDSYVQVAHVSVDLGVAFLVGFAAAFVWFLRRQQRLAA